MVTRQRVKSVFTGFIVELETNMERGVVFADNMKSSGQYLAAYKKASQMLRMIGRTIIYKNKSILLSLYKTLVRPPLGILLISLVTTL